MRCYVWSIWNVIFRLWYSSKAVIAKPKAEWLFGVAVNITLAVMDRMALSAKPKSPFEGQHHGMVNCWEMFPLYCNRSILHCPYTCTTV